MRTYYDVVSRSFEWLLMLLLGSIACAVISILAYGTPNFLNDVLLTALAMLLIQIGKILVPRITAKLKRMPFPF